MFKMGDSTLKRALGRLFWLMLAAVLNTALAWLTNEYSTWSFYPVIYWLLTTLKDFVNPKLPNTPEK